MRPAVLLGKVNIYAAGFIFLLSCKRLNKISPVTDTPYNNNNSFSDNIITDTFKLITNAFSPPPLLLLLLLLLPPLPHPSLPPSVERMNVMKSELVKKALVKASSLLYI